MKIIFLCSSLEPGKDGVGDYSRRLAAAIIKSGHTAGIIALNDKFADDNIYTNQASDGCDIATLRLPAKHSYKQRFAVAGDWIIKQNPVWLSLQFVPFGFNAKGLPFGLARGLKQLGRLQNWHIMFHELWVGMDRESQTKFKVWGWLQKQIIKTIISGLKPGVVHTQTWLYKQHLLKLGVNAGLLPLFSNIPFLNNTVIAANKSKLSIILFGNIHHGAPVRAFALEAAEWGQKNNIVIEVNFAGRCGNGLTAWTGALHAAGIQTKITGEDLPEKISEALQAAQWGVITTPFSLFEKSGSYAAMREHLLPVICVSRQWTPCNAGAMPKTEGIFEYVPGNLQTIFGSGYVSNPMACYTVSNAAEQLMESLN